MTKRRFFLAFVLPFFVNLFVSTAARTADTWDVLEATSDLIVPSLVHRNGPYAELGVLFADGFQDYFALLNRRDGGIDGRRVRVVECETGYSNAAGTVCYNELKAQGGLLFHATSAGLVQALIPIVQLDQMPLMANGYGPGMVADGSAFPYVFSAPATDWSAVTGILRYIADQVGGLGQLRDLNISYVFHNSAYGQAPAEVLRAASATYGFDLNFVPVTHPGLEQTAAWRSVIRANSDWVILWGWDELTTVALREAANVRFPVDRIVGNWWSSAEQDVLSLGGDADGYLAATPHAPGAGFRVHDEIFEQLFDEGEGETEHSKVGSVYYNRGIMAAVLAAEALRYGIALAAPEDPKPSHVRDALETLRLDEERLAIIGLEGFMAPIAVSCEDHEGGGRIAIQRWDAETATWSLVSGFIDPITTLIEPIKERQARRYLTDAGLTERNCMK